MTIQECGMSDAVLQTLAQYMERATDDIKASSLYFHDSGNGVFGPSFSISPIRCDIKHILFYRPGMKSCMVRKLRILARKGLNIMPKWKICTVTKIWMQPWIPLTISSVDDV